MDRINIYEQMRRFAVIGTVEFECSSCYLEAESVVQCMTVTRWQIKKMHYFSADYPSSPVPEPIYPPT